MAPSPPTLRWSPPSIAPAPAGQPGFPRHLTAKESRPLSSAARSNVLCLTRAPALGLEPPAPQAECSRALAGRSGGCRGPLLLCPVPAGVPSQSDHPLPSTSHHPGHQPGSITMPTSARVLAGGFSRNPQVFPLNHLLPTDPWSSPHLSPEGRTPTPEVVPTPL